MRANENKGNTCWPSLILLTEDVGISPHSKSKISRSIKRLDEQRLVTVHEHNSGKKNVNNVYEVHPGTTAQPLPDGFEWNQLSPSEQRRRAEFLASTKVPRHTAVESEATGVVRHTAVPPEPGYDVHTRPGYVRHTTNEVNEGLAPTNSAVNESSYECARDESAAPAAGPSLEDIVAQVAVYEEGLSGSPGEAEGAEIAAPAIDSGPSWSWEYHAAMYDSER
ncbi:hypothetical protein NQ036_03520 [Brevibacterium sp. 91QC2O2]|uniref:hypothetical protein n=1 Tax=Brevibacterium sp. 91QC2O2 TaxID=2968458 RepID=UPI00211C7802|nr:hypothetical protein [Brevibacterium sp. 91QC2O2]MCQ9367316.1 hypothetical protein [Brevibacterium sp. 91QC2O2]